MNGGEGEARPAAIAEAARAARSLLLAFALSMAPALPAGAEGVTALAHPPAAGTAHPALLVLLHGSGADERDMIGLWRQLPRELLVVSPRAPFAAGGGYVWYRKGATRDADIAASLHEIDAVVDGARERFGAGRVFVGGFSQGAVMSYEAALRDPRRYNGAIILSGSLPAHARPTRGDGGGRIPSDHVPFFVAHGSADERIPFAAATAARAELQRLGEPVAFHRYEGLGHGTSDAEIADAAAWLAERLKE